MSDVEESKKGNKQGEEEQGDSPKDIHPNIDAFLRTFAQWTIEELHIKKGGGNERSEKGS